MHDAREFVQGPSRELHAQCLLPALTALELGSCALGPEGARALCPGLRVRGERARTARPSLLTCSFLLSLIAVEWLVACLVLLYLPAAGDLLPHCACPRLAASGDHSIAARGCWPHV